MAGAVVLLRPLPLQERLRPAVAALLLQVGPQRVASMVPDHGPRVEPQRPPPLQDSPADIDVISRGAEPRVEPTDLREGGLAERHVAPRDVLRLLVGEQ